jgi:glycerol kinase
MKALPDCGWSEHDTMYTWPNRFENLSSMAAKFWEHKPLGILVLGITNMLALVLQKILVKKTCKKSADQGS